MALLAFMFLVSVFVAGLISFDAHRFVYFTDAGKNYFRLFYDLFLWAVLELRPLPTGLFYERRLKVIRGAQPVIAANSRARRS